MEIGRGKWIWKFEIPTKKIGSGYQSLPTHKMGKFLEPNRTWKSHL